MATNSFYYSPTTRGFYLEEIHGSNMPEDVVAISKARHAELMSQQSSGKVIVPGEDGFPVAVDPQPTPPKVVSMRQARLALLGAGLLTDVAAAIESLPSPQKEAAQIEWEYSQEVHREQALVITLAGALNLDEAALDHLFMTAATL